MTQQHTTTGKFPEAVNLYSKVVQLEPSNTAALSNRACCYAKLLEFSLSIGDCDKVLEMEPDNGVLGGGVYLVWVWGLVCGGLMCGGRMENGKRVGEKAI